MQDTIDAVKVGSLASYLQCHPTICKHLAAVGLSQIIPFISQAAARENLQHLQHLDLLQVLGFNFDLNSPPAMCHERTQADQEVVPTSKSRHSHQGEQGYCNATKNLWRHRKW